MIELVFVESWLEKGDALASALYELLQKEISYTPIKVEGKLSPNIFSAEEHLLKMKPSWVIFYNPEDSMVISTLSRLYSRSQKEVNKIFLYVNSVDKYLEAEDKYGTVYTVKLQENLAQTAKLVAEKILNHPNATDQICSTPAD